MSYSSYPIRFKVRDALSKLGLFKKSVLLESRGYYRTQSGGFCNNHFNWISKRDVRSLTIEELKSIL